MGAAGRLICVPASGKIAKPHQQSPEVSTYLSAPNVMVAQYLALSSEQWKSLPVPQVNL